MTSVNQMNEDIDEARKLLERATRQRVIDALTAQITQWENDVKRMTKDARKDETVNKSNIFQKQIDTYAWDQSPKFMKIYVTVPGVQSLCKEKISCEFKDRSFKLTVSELQNYTYTLSVSCLLHTINTRDSFTKVKTDTVLVMMKKEDESKTWEHVTQQEQKTKERKKPQLDKDADPQDGLMGMLKDMYEDGDDEMKRTISKAFYESRVKKNPDLDRPL